jgi:hypothetical protein
MTAAWPAMAVTESSTKPRQCEGVGRGAAQEQDQHGAQDGHEHHAERGEHRSQPAIQT